MKRRLFNLAAAVSLVMMLAVVVLWVRSYRKLDAGDQDGFTVIGPDSVWSVVSVSGGAAVLRIRDHSDAKASSFEWMGIRYTRNRSKSGGELLSIAARYWQLCLLAAVVPLIFVACRLHERRELRRRHIGHCPHCGYDLRATPDRCPECGTSVAAKPAEAAA
jgi:hypothetical protein